MTARPLDLERTYAASANELFRAWTAADALPHWFQPLPDLAVTRATAEARRGGGFTLEFDGGRVTVQLCLAEFVADRRLAGELQWLAAGDRRCWRIGLDFAAGLNGTTLRLRHEDVADAERTDVAATWKRLLGRLIAACPRALDDWYAGMPPRAGFRSPFGGLWPDRPDAAAALAARQARGLLDDGDAERFRHWLAKGYVVLPGAVARDRIDALRADVARDWERGNPAVTIELCDGDGGFVAMQPALRDRPHKVLEYHAGSPLARDVQFAPAIRRFLELLFERPAMAFQSLLFRWGTEQAMHQDTAYVVLRSPLEFVGCWIALEDVTAGSGELQYFEGSHRIDEFRWFGRGRGRPPGYEDDREFLAWVRQRSLQAGCPLVRFLPRAGDALLWHADLVHGGSQRIHRERTRWSLVTHFCPWDVEPIGVADRRHTGRLEHAPGCYYSHPLYDRR